MFESQGLKVSRLIRTRYSTIILPKELRTGRFVELDAKDIGKLVESVGLRQRQGTGLNTAAKEKQARIHKKPLKSREVKRHRNDRDDNKRNERQNSRRNDKKSGTPSLKNAKFFKV